jgi:ribosome-associated protein
MKTESLEIAPGIKLSGSEFELDFVRASGPGGQNVNKVASSAQLRFDIRRSSLMEDVRRRLIKLAGKRVTGEGILIIEARRFRTQEQNREDALGRLTQLVKSALKKPPFRKRTRPTKASKEKRLEAKRRRGQTKSFRRDRTSDG